MQCITTLACFFPCQSVPINSVFFISETPSVSGFRLHCCSSCVDLLLLLFFLYTSLFLARNMQKRRKPEPIQLNPIPDGNTINGSGATEWVSILICFWYSDRGMWYTDTCFLIYNLVYVGFSMTAANTVCVCSSTLHQVFVWVPETLSSTATIDHLHCYQLLYWENEIFFLNLKSYWHVNHWPFLK